MNILELLGGGQAAEITEMERMSKSIWSRQRWATLTPLQRIRIEIGYAAAKAVENHTHINPTRTIDFWLGLDEEGVSAFSGVTMEVQKDGEEEVIKLTDGTQEFLMRDEGDGLNITAVAKIGEAQLQDH